jgi:hypothetical protein
LDQQFKRDLGFYFPIRDDGKLMAARIMFPRGKIDHGVLPTQRVGPGGIRFFRDLKDFFGSTAPRFDKIQPVFQAYIMGLFPKNNKRKSKGQVFTKHYSVLV